MKNKYLTKLLCITMISVMVLSSAPAAAMAAQETEQTETDRTEGTESGFVPGLPEIEPSPAPGETPTETPTPEPTETPAETPEPTPDETPGETPTETPTPEPTETPTETPAETPTPEPTPELPGEAPDKDSGAEEKIAWIMAQLERLGEITPESEELLQQIRGVYETLTEEEKFLVTNYELLLEAEAKLSAQKEEQEVEQIEPAEPAEEPQDFANAAEEQPEKVLEAEPVYLTNAVSNLHAGKDFYLDSLKEEYQLAFSEDFAEVMDEIEKEYKEKHKLIDDSDRRQSKVTTSKDTLLVKNWQDILAVYVYRQKQAGVSEYTINREAKPELAKIFAQMNPILRDKKDITKVTYGNLHINDYIKKQKIAKKDRAVLKKYVQTDCKLLCATVTAAKGFVRQSVGEEVSEERVNVIAAGYSLVGKIGYFWGGKSSALGWDSAWGSAAKVDAEGSKTTGMLRAYGLDCSGFVTWAFNNGYQDTAVGGQIGDGTTDQWNSALTVKEQEAQPGDLVFQRGPEAGSDNHVGIICGQTDSGDWIAVHCSSSKNGVTVGEAYSASFRYIRRPACFPTPEELQKETEQTDAWRQLLKNQKNK